MQRRNLVARAIQGLRVSGESAAAEKLVLLLAEDGKWEVRKAVAENLLQMPEPLYEKIIKILAMDANTYVARAVEREMARRSVLSKSEKRRQPTAIKRLATELEAKYGEDGLKLAKKYAEKTTEMVVRTASHDINGVLTPIKPYLADLHQIAADPTAKRKVSRIISGIKYLERMLKDMRQWAADVEIILVEEDLVSLLEYAAQDARDHLKAQGRNASLVAVYFDVVSRPRLRVSRPQLQMAFTNIIKNAIEAHATSATDFKSGSVTVGVSEVESLVTVTITDTGMGMNPRDLEKITEFIPGNTSKKHLGTGYGLPIALRNIEAHGGKITISSADDAGTTVTISLPVQPLS